MTVPYVNQLDLIAAFLTQAYAAPGSHEWHVLAYTDELSDADREELARFAGSAIAPEPARKGHFNLIHLSFPSFGRWLLELGKFPMKIGGVREFLIFGPSSDRSAIVFQGARTEQELYFGTASPQFPLPDDRRRIVWSGPECPFSQV